MKNIFFALCILTTTVLFAGCGPTISGKDDASFAASKAKMEEKLSAAQKTDLEKALRVLYGKAMVNKFKGTAEAKDKSIDDMLMSYIDGKTFSGIVDAAEDFLKKDNQDKIVRTKAEIDSLNKEGAKLKEQTKVLTQFKLIKMELTKDKFFEDSIPYLDMTFINNTGDEVIGEHMIRYDVLSKSTGKVLSGVGTGGTFNDDAGLKPNETYDLHEVLSSDVLENSAKFWKTAVYPIKDLSTVDLEVKAYPSIITTKKGGKVEFPRALEGINKEIQKLNVSLKQLESSKGTLDEYELTK